jgi:hypothetical protein
LELTVNASFFEQGTPTNNTLELTLTGDPGSYTLNLTTGVGTLTLRQGLYQVRVQDPDNKTPTGEQLTYLEDNDAPPGEHLVFDGKNIAQPLEILTDGTYTARTVREERLEEIGHKWGGRVRVPLPGALTFRIYGSGNPTCENWHPEKPEIDTCPDVQTWPPGRPFDQTGIDYFFQYVEETRQAFQNPLITWQPYEIQGFVDDSVSIQDHMDGVDAFGLANVTSENTHIIIGVGGTPFRSGSDLGISPTGIEVLYASSATANGGSATAYSAEVEIFGVNENQVPDDCSIWDYDDDGLLPECNRDPDGPSYYEYDLYGLAVMAQYFSRAQVQPVPFNVVLPEP